MNRNLETPTFLLCLLLVSIGFLMVLQPFFGAIFWACAIAIIFYPLQLKITKKLGGRNTLGAFITLCLCIFIVVLPMTLLVSSVITQGTGIYAKLESGELNPAQYIEQIRTAFPALQQTMDRFGVDIAKVKENSLNLAMSSGKLAAQNALSLGQNTFRLLLNICLMLYLTFFLLRDGNYLLELLIRALPLGDARERLLFAKFGEVTRATIKGNLVIAVVQGSLGGFIFWALDIPGALLWGVVMAVLSLIPAVGPAIVWALLSLLLLLLLPPLSISTEATTAAPERTADPEGHWLTLRRKGDFDGLRIQRQGTGTARTGGRLHDHQCAAQRARILGLGRRPRERVAIPALVGGSESQSEESPC